MPITLADVELLFPTTQLCRWIERNLPVEDAFPWAASSWGGPTLDVGTPGVPAAAMPRTLEVNRFFWPQGASRWAYGAFLASGRMGNLVRAAADDDNTLAGVTGGGGAAGQQSTPIKLKLSTPRAGQETPEELAVGVRLLRVVPLTQLRADEDSGFEPNNLVLLVVVDARYYWQAAPCPDFGILPYGSYAPPPPADSSDQLPAGPPPPAPQWADLVAKLASALGATIAVDAVPAAYLGPDPALNLAGMPAGPALDAVLANAGLRLVANYDGTFTAQGAADAVQARLLDDQSAAGQARALRAGGDGFGDEL